MEIDVREELVKRIKTYLAEDWGTVEPDVSEVKFKLLNVHYDDLSNRSVSPLTLQNLTVENPTAATVKRTFNISKQSTDQFTWSINEGLKLGAQARFEVGVPLLGDAGVTSSFELNVGAEQTNTQSVVRKWEESQSIEVPPNTNIEAQFIVSEGEVNSPFQATIQAYGKIEVKVQDEDGRLKTLPGTLEEGFGGVRPAWISRVLSNDGDRVFTVKGNFHAKIGINSRIITKSL